MDYASRYRADIDLGAVNDSHVLAIGRVPARSRVLDLGAADGSVAEVLTSMGCSVSAVERDPAAAAAAERWCERVHRGDLDRDDLREVFAAERFDVILMLDVLEHLADPTRVLTEVRELLAPGGWAVISLPNVTHISLRLEILSGRFVYRDAGLLDRTHLRFFDTEGVQALLRESGWEAFDTARVIKRLGETEIEVDPPDADLLRSIEADREAYTYQFVISAAPTTPDEPFVPPTLPAAMAQRAAADVTAWAVHLQSVLDAREAELEQVRAAAARSQLVLAGTAGLADELEEMRRNALDRRRQLADLLVALREDTERLRTGIEQL